jgi:cobalt-precorrin 5A hydrolase
MTTLSAMASAPAKPIRVVALTHQGAALARRICPELPGARCWLPEAQEKEPGDRSFRRVSQVFEQAFALGEDLVCVMAAGIVVRGIAPFLKGKDSDPAVVVVDEAGQFAISLLSGHLGGANDLARRLALILGATPVITTATDVRGLPALDVAAARLGLAIENLPGVRQIHLALLGGQAVRVVDPQGYLAALVAENPGLLVQEAEVDLALAAAPRPTVYVGCQERPWPPGWLILRPRNLVAGVGCHKGTPGEEIYRFIKETFQQHQLSLLSLRALATIAAKKEEPGLKEAAERLGVELVWFSAPELQEMTVPHPSPQVVRHLGVASVSEAAALRAGGQELIVPKCKSANVTVAVARVISPR